MKAFYFLLALLLSILSFMPKIQADSERSYRDYLYQFDLYRQKNSEFTVAKNEYQKFKSLTSQTVALEKTIAMLSQRDLLLRAYLLLLNEKLNEDRGVNESEKITYQILIKNEISFLDTHSIVVNSIGSLEDATDSSRELESHYVVLGASMRQTIIGISLGQLFILSRQFDTLLADAKALLSTNKGIFTPQKQATVDRWILQIQNIRSLYQQKIDSITTQNTQIKSSNIDSQDELFRQLKKELAQARQYLAEGTAFIAELTAALRYKD